MNANTSLLQNHCVQSTRTATLDVKIAMHTTDVL